jgi:hypothetical protein
LLVKRGLIYGEHAAEILKRLGVTAPEHEVREGKLGPAEEAASLPLQGLKE